MSVQQRLTELLQQGFSCQVLAIENESHMHSGPATESHFKVTLVSEAFNGKRLVARHQLVYQQVTELLNNPIHALALHLYTAEEWQARDEQSPQSPNCRGGSKAD